MKLFILIWLRAIEQSWRQSLLFNRTVSWQNVSFLVEIKTEKGGTCLVINVYENKLSFAT